MKTKTCTKRELDQQSIKVSRDMSFECRISYLEASIEQLTMRKLTTIHQEAITRYNSIFEIIDIY